MSYMHPHPQTCYMDIKFQPDFFHRQIVKYIKSGGNYLEEMDIGFFKDVQSILQRPWQCTVGMHPLTLYNWNFP